MRSSECEVPNRVIVWQVPESDAIRIELLGTPTMRRGAVASVPGPLLLRLAAEHPNPVRREDLIESLYGDDDSPDARNRLRVALTRLRRVVPLAEVDDLVALDPAKVRVDVTHLRQRLADIALEPSAEGEASALRELLAPLGTLLFPEADRAWQLEAQSRWSQEACLALERLGALAEEAIDNPTAAEAAEACLRHFPFEGTFWERYLQAMTRLGRAQAARRNLAAARRRARAEGLTLDERLEAWTPEDEDQGRLGPELAPGESLALQRFFRRTLLTQPELAVEILGSTSFRPEVLRTPRAVLPLLREALALPVPPSEARERVQVRVITALSLLEDHAQVLPEVDRFLMEPVAPARRRIALLNGSFSNAMLGNLDQAVAQVEEAMALINGPSAANDRAECQAQRATYWMLAGRFSEAEAEMRESLNTLEAAALEGTERDLLSIRGNLGLCLLVQGRPVEAREVLRPVVDAARRLDLPVILALNAPVLGLAIAETGGSVGPLLTDGLRAAYRMGVRRAVVAVGFVGRALMALGQEPGPDVLCEAWAHRRASPVPPNATEQFLFGPVLDQRPEVSRSLVDFVRATLRVSARVAGA